MCLIISGQHLIDFEIISFNEARDNNRVIKFKQSMAICEIDADRFLHISGKDFTDIGKCISGNDDLTAFV